MHYRIHGKNVPFSMALKFEILSNVFLLLFLIKKKKKKKKKLIVPLCEGDPKGADLVE